MKLHFGVVDAPYGDSYASQASQGAKAPPGPSAASKTTTGDVAEFLEARYGVMRAFYDIHEEEILAELFEALQDRMESVAMGAPLTGELLPDGALSGVEQMFREMLDRRELDGRIPGVPTAAALAGVDHRLKHPYARSNPARPSFIDTGHYQAFMRAWLADD